MKLFFPTRIAHGQDHVARPEVELHRNGPRERVALEVGLGLGLPAAGMLKCSAQAGQSIFCSPADSVTGITSRHFGHRTSMNTMKLRAE